MIRCSSKAVAIVGRSDVVDLENHLDHLSGQEDLLLLAVQRLNHVLLFHVGSSLAQTVDAKSRIVLGHLTCLNLGKRVDGRQAGILSQCKRNGLESFSESAERILLQCFDLEKKTNGYRRQSLDTFGSFTLTESASLATAMAQEISGAPPP